MNKKDKLWFASAGSMAQVPWPGAMVYYFPKGHAEHVGVEFHLADSRAQMISCQVSVLTLFANPDTNEPVAKIGLVPMDPSLDQGYAKIHRDDIVDYPLSYKTLTSSDANGPLAVLKHCVNTIFPPMDSESEEQTILVNDISGTSWEFRHTFKRAQSQDHLRGDWRRFANNNQLKRGDSIVFMKAEADEVLVGIAKELSRIERATSVSHEVSMAYSRAPRGSLLPTSGGSPVLRGNI
ncbi:auxin response factor 18-like [Cornus florida]|uniref:auxin response factor 18-like n=1 Tax=Cornus florida TaxID=4283 RepID=UPI002897A289|nr:auxin response factor 18-like [Cornus florida]